MPVQYATESKKALNPSLPHKRTNAQRILFVAIVVTIAMLSLLGMLIFLGSSPVAQFTYKQF